MSTELSRPDFSLPSVTSRTIACCPAASTKRPPTGTLPSSAMLRAIPPFSAALTARVLASPWRTDEDPSESTQSSGTNRLAFAGHRTFVCGQLRRRTDLSPITSRWPTFPRRCLHTTALPYVTDLLSARLSETRPRDPASLRDRASCDSCGR